MIKNFGENCNSKIEDLINQISKMLFEQRTHNPDYCILIISHYLDLLFKMDSKHKKITIP
jgi:hypothetical protein